MATPCTILADNQADRIDQWRAAHAHGYPLHSWLLGLVLAAFLEVASTEVFLRCADVARLTHARRVSRVCRIFKGVPHAGAAGATRHENTAGGCLRSERLVVATEDAHNMWWCPRLFSGESPMPARPAQRRMKKW